MPKPIRKFKRKGIMVSPVFPKGFQDFSYDKMRKANPLPKLTPKQKKINKMMQEYRRKQSLERDPSGFTQLLNEGGMPESRIILPKRKTIVKPEVFKEKSDTGVTKKGSKVTVGKKILGVDVIGQVAQQKYSSPRGESKRRTKSFTAQKNFGDRGSFGIEAYDSTSSNPMNRSKTKGIKGSLTLTFSEGGIARGGRAAIRGIKFTGVK
jgi:hypothetical protein